MGAVSWGGLTEAGPIDGGRDPPWGSHRWSTSAALQFWAPSTSRTMTECSWFSRGPARWSRCPTGRGFGPGKEKALGGICQQPFAASKEVTKKADRGSSQPCSRITWATDAGSWIQPSVTWSRSLL